MTDEEFAGWWSSLKANIGPNTPVPRWSAAKGYLGGDFLVSVPAMSPECVVVEEGSGIYQRMIFAGEFRRVLAVWDLYCSGKITRKAIAELTHHSTYLLPIVRWLEEKTKATS